MAEGRTGEAVGSEGKTEVEKSKAKGGDPMETPRVLDSKKVFVFGSNLRGIHGAGAAKDAVTHYGAQQGVGVGRTGQSYAIPTKDRNFSPMPLYAISAHVFAFTTYAREHASEEFFVTRIGCGFAGYTDEQIAPMFVNAPLNCELPQGWNMLIQRWKVEQGYLIEPPAETGKAYALMLMAGVAVGIALAMIFYH